MSFQSYGPILWELWIANFVICLKTHRIHGTGIFTYIWMISMVNVGKYTINTWILWGISTLKWMVLKVCHKEMSLGTQIICIHLGDDFLCEKSVCNIVEGNQVGSLCI